MKIRDRVAAILRDYPEARNDDKTLLIIYMQHEGLNLSHAQIQTFRKMPSVETIRRSRQQLQMEGKYPANAKVDEARFQKFREMKYGIKSSPAEDILEKPMDNTRMEF